MSTYVDYSITTREEFKSWILRKLGEPLITVELTDDQLDDCINDAVELFTKYCIQEQMWYAVDVTKYKNPTLSGDIIVYEDDGSGGSEKGFKLPKNVTGVSEIYNNTQAGLGGGINTLFSNQNAMINAGVAFPGMGGTSGGWIQYHMAMSFLDLTKRMMASEYDFEYNVRTKELTLIPDPSKGKISGHAVVGCHVIREETLQYGEDWVKKYALSMAKILLGTIRKKFEGVQLLGGGTVDTSIGDEGVAERDNLEEKLRRDEGGVFGFFLG